jgi:hypothetical protein
MAEPFEGYAALAASDIFVDGVFSNGEGWHSDVDSLTDAVGEHGSGCDKDGAGRVEVAGGDAQHRVGA